MAFDNPEREKPEVCEYKAALERVLAEIDKLRADMAPLLEEYQYKERMRAELSRGRIQNGRCDCSPTREAYLNNNLTDRINKFFSN